MKILEKYELSDEVKSKLAADLENEIKSRVVAAQNDPEFHDNIRNEVAGKFYSVAEKSIKNTFGIDLDKIDPELKGDKRIKAALELGAETLKSSKDQTNQELQKQLLDLKTQFDTFKEVDHVKEVNKVKSKYNSKLINAKIYKDSSDIKVISDEIDKTAFIDVFLKKNNYNVSWDEEKEDYVILTDKNLIPTKDGKSLSNKELFEEALKPVLEKSNGAPTTIPSGGKPIVVPKGNFSESTRAKAAAAGVTLPA